MHIHGYEHSRPHTHTLTCACKNLLIPKVVTEINSNWTFTDTNPGIKKNHNLIKTVVVFWPSTRPKNAIPRWCTGRKWHIPMASNRTPAIKWEVNIVKEVFLRLCHCVCLYYCVVMMLHEHGDDNITQSPLQNPNGTPKSIINSLKTTLKLETCVQAKKPPPWNQIHLLTY